jgi:hypothetical protein
VSQLPRGRLGRWAGRRVGGVGCGGSECTPAGPSHLSCTCPGWVAPAATTSDAPVPTCSHGLAVGYSISSLESRPHIARQIPEAVADIGDSRDTRVALGEGTHHRPTLKFDLLSDLNSSNLLNSYYLKESAAPASLWGAVGTPTYVAVTMSCAFPVILASACSTNIYTVEGQKLGSGTHATVFRASRNSSGYPRQPEYVAIKFVPLTSYRHAVIINEVSIVNRLNHPHVVRSRTH